MSKSRLEKNFSDVKDVFARFHGDEHMKMVAIVQLIEREKIRLINNQLVKLGREPVPTDPPRLPGGQEWEWIIDVPKPWVNLISKLSDA